MSVQSSINLIQTKTGASPQVALVESYLARIRLYALVALSVTGLLSGGIFYYVQSRVTSLNETKSTLTRQIAAQAAKESLLIAIQGRVKVASAIVESQKDWAKLFSSIQTVTGKTQVSSLTLTDQNKVTIAMDAESLDDVLALVRAITQEAEAKRIKTPELTSFILSRDSGYQVSVTFVTLL